MANVDNPNGFRFSRSLVAGCPILCTGTLTTNQSVKAGDALIFSAGVLSIALSNSGTIHGVAAEDKTTTSTADSIVYHPAVPWIEFEAQCSGSYENTADDFTAVDIEGTTGIMEVNENANTEGVFVITEMVNDGVNAEGANARVRGYFLRSSFYPAVAAL